MFKYVDAVLCILYVYMYYCVIIFGLFLFFLFSSAPNPLAGVTLCVYWSVIQQRPVENCAVGGVDLFLF
jgi:hypothetical protein